MTDLQRNDEWHAARLGKATGSKISDVMASGKVGAPSVTRANYLAQLLCERLTGNPTESYSNAAMQHGIDTEAEAKTAYEFQTGVHVADVGFVDHPTIAMSGASPDGLIGDDGLIEIKCPNSATHLATLRGASIDGKYIKQMQWQMACTGRSWCDFASYDPRFPFEHQLYVKRVMRDPQMIAEIEAAVCAFLNDVHAAVLELSPVKEAA
jgi:putative phage-type endonuclease